MNIEGFREFCLSLPGSSEKMPFQAAQSILAFYVGGRIFCFFDIDRFDACTVQCDPDRIDELKARYMAVGAPYNMSPKHWISIRFNDDMTDDEIKRWVRNSHDIIFRKAEDALFGNAIRTGSIILCFRLFCKFVNIDIIKYKDFHFHSKKTETEVYLFFAEVRINLLHCKSLHPGQPENRALIQSLHPD